MAGEELTRLIDFTLAAHARQPVKPSKAYRKWDGRTPYSIHPIWCAMTLLHETSPVLTEELRYPGAEALILHDILEDTTTVLPEWVNDWTRTLVNEMTFVSTEEEMRLVWERQPFVRLMKLYDKVSNLMDGAWMSEEREEEYAAYTKKLADDARENFGELNIIKIAYALTK
jgi:(p)ppGpp synthase/HD superfamily hydrolase